MLGDAPLIPAVPAGIDEALVEHYDGSDFLQAHFLIRLVPAFTAILQSYQKRAAERGQSFEHMVLLEAAVESRHVSSLLPHTYLSSRAPEGMQLWLEEGSIFCSSGNPFREATQLIVSVSQLILTYTEQRTDALDLELDLLAQHHVKHVQSEPVSNAVSAVVCTVHIFKTKCDQAGPADD